MHPSRTAPQLPVVVVVGAGYAGRCCVARLRALRTHATVVLVEAAPAVYERIRMHERVAGRALKPVVLNPLLPGPRGARATSRVDNRRVTGADLHRQTLAFEQGPELRFDHLVVATGGHMETGVGGVPGALEHALSIERDDLPHDALEVAVVGGGLTAIETAAELAETGRRVTLVCRQLGGGLSPKARAHVERAFARLEVRVLSGRSVCRVRADAVELDDGSTVMTDACVWTAGQATAALPRLLGLEVDEAGRAHVDATLRTLSHPSVWVAGDAARVAGPGGAPLRAACATAMPMGCHVADNIHRQLARKPARPFRFRYLFQCISLGRRDAVIQFVDGQDRPTARVWRGRFAAWFKERICRMTISVPRWEARLRLRLYRWPEPRETHVGRAHAGSVRALVHKEPR